MQPAKMPAMVLPVIYILPEERCIASKKDVSVKCNILSELYSRHLSRLSKWHQYLVYTQLSSLHNFFESLGGL